MSRLKFDECDDCVFRCIDNESPLCEGCNDAKRYIPEDEYDDGDNEGFGFVRRLVLEKA